MKRVGNNKAVWGFSLLEIIMVLAIMGLLSAGIFTIIASTFQLSGELKNHQDRSQVRYRLLEIFETNFTALPAQAKFRLETSQLDGQYATTLSLGEAPMIFQRSTADSPLVKNVVIRTGRGRGGFIRVTIHYLDRDESRQFEKNDMGPLDHAPSIVLAERMKKFEWSLFDSATQRWSTKWTSTAKRPTLAKLTFAYEGDRQERKHVFWIPPRRP